ncbi:hypothetical protein [Alloprevotella tannerae]|jgi:hypothetical protein|uniref:RipA family octameric membrane protein n=1 Tax=Alloprevotella tannerae TaxID=76122 RepID=UPI0028EBEE48|nr:hypothetical protein [Alloprevotella tannerae]
MKKKNDPISNEEYIKCFNPNKDAPELLDSAFEIALDTRKFEIELYWKRTGYFVLFIGAVFVAYQGFSKECPHEWLLPFLASIGYLLSLLWYMANRGSKYWQENWEHNIEELSTYIGKPIFGIIKCPTQKSPYSDLMDAYPFSLSKVNQMVSIIITASWIIVFIKELYALDLGYSCQCQCKWIFKVFIGFILICLSKYIINKCKGFSAKTQINGENKDYFCNYKHIQ